MFTIYLYINFDFVVILPWNYWFLFLQRIYQNYKIKWLNLTNCTNFKYSYYTNNDTLNYFVKLIKLI